jgi:hypothetical protein
MSKALQETDRLRAMIAWHSRRDDIREIHEPLEGYSDLRAAVGALDHAFKTEGNKPTGTESTGKDAQRL